MYPFDMRTFLVVCVGILLLSCGVAAQTPVDRAVRYLSIEVPAWREDNGCFSCHNNGDGARALYTARARGLAVPPEALAGTTEWLTRPDQWESSPADPVFSDKKLARIHFAAALTAATDSGFTENRKAVVAAAESLLRFQAANGSWEIEDLGESPGSPVTWGTALATYFSLQTLRAAGEAHFDKPRARAERWLRKLKPRYTPDAAAVLLTFPKERVDLVERLRQTQTSDGGWGPSPNVPAEAFDTALVLLALHGADSNDPVIARGRAFLIRMQLESGGWQETTRPPGSKSYAQHISTTAWATMALLLTDPERNR